MCHLSYPQLLSCAYSYKYLEVLWLPKRTQLWACFNTEPNRLYRRLRLFPSKLQEYTPPPFSRLSTQYHIDPLLACLLSLATSRRVCDYSGVQSSVTGILRMGDMNIHITWLTHVRTGPKKKIATGYLHGLVSVYERPIIAGGRVWMAYSIFFGVTGKPEKNLVWLAQPSPHFALRIKCYCCYRMICKK